MIGHHAYQIRLTQALELLEPYADTILANETGEEVATIVETLLESVSDEMADFLYEEWDAILTSLELSRDGNLIYPLS